ncbi:MAG: DUF3078 domain-containing protein [Candidatus Eisenbacteria bacterium]|nr:DUF3078 domain-containing protein [Candidatus Eisenbacteria bacterium]
MRPRALAVVLALLLSSPALADEAKSLEPGPWKYTTVLNLNLSQSSFSSNWAGGDKGSIVWVLGANASAERQFSSHFNLLNTLQLAYGQTSKQVEDGAGGRTWDTPDKTTDQIVLETVGRWTTTGPLDPYLSLRGETQFEDQSNPLGVLRFNPVKLKESAGIARVLRKSADSEAITRLGFGLRQAIGRTLTAGPPIGKERYTTLDGGLEWQTSVKQPILQKKVLWTGSLLVFQPLFFSDASDLKAFDAEARAAVPAHENVAGYWRTADLGAQSLFSAQITRSLGVELFAQWVYDKFDNATNVDPSSPLAVRTAEISRSVRKAGQFKETLALALKYQIF